MQGLGEKNLKRNRFVAGLLDRPVLKASIYAREYSFRRLLPPALGQFQCRRGRQMPLVTPGTPKPPTVLLAQSR